MTINMQLQEIKYHSVATRRTLERIRRHRTVPLEVIRRYYETSRHARRWGINTKTEDHAIIRSLEGREII